MKVIIAGGRNYRLKRSDFNIFDLIDITEIVSGCCSGADKAGEGYAERELIPVKRFPANWNKHGRAAGPIRNREMAQYADAVVLFPGGRGTQSMHNEAVKAGIKIYDMRGE